MKNILHYSKYVLIVIAVSIQACSTSSSVMEKEPVSSQNQTSISTEKGAPQISIFEALVSWRTTGNPNTDSLISDLGNLQIEGPSASVRYQAFLASYIMKDEVALYLLFDPSLYKSSEEYFKDLGVYVHAELVTAFVEASL